jgi:hypothetical protein
MSNSLKALFLKTLDEGLQGNSLQLCTRWAAYKRIMGGDFKGPYSTKYHPWCQEMLDSKAPFNYAMKSAQMGVTEVGINRALWTVDIRKKDVLYVLPTAINAGDFSQARFAVALELSPRLQTIFTSTNKVNLKQAGAVNLYIRGSRGDSNLKSIPVAVMILDELDEMDQRQIWLALERLSGHIEKEVWAISTPTVPDYGIHKLFQQSTQEHFIFRCPCCSRSTELVWPDCVEIIGESVYDPRCAESFLKCKECGGKLDHQAKPEFLGTGKWQVTDQNANPEMRGFYINQLYSYTITPGELVVAYHRGLGDEAADQEFHNSKLGLPKLGDSARVTDTSIQAAIRDYSRHDTTPTSAGKIITMGVDQGKWNHYTVCEWDVGNWSNDLNESSVPRVLDMGKFKEEDWDALDELMSQWQVLAAVVDADPQINEARRFARKYWGYVWLCRYRKVPTAKEVVISDEDSGAPIATVDRTNWATATLGRYARGRIILPRDTTEEFKAHMKNFVRCYKKDDDGDMVATFVKTGPDHYAHSLIYAEIALPFVASIKTGQNITKFI